MLTFAVYDVTGIQSYIFNSNQLKENIGASNLIADITSTFLFQAIQEETNNSITDDWFSQANFHMQEESCHLDAELIYSGGGNALVAYKDKTIAENVGKNLSRKLLENLGVVPVMSVIRQVKGENFKEERNWLMAELRKKKNERVVSNPLLGSSITELCTKTQLPVGVWDDLQKRYIPNEIVRKRTKEKNSEFVWTKGMNFSLPKEFDDLGRSEGESNIAVVHIDGNSLGKVFDRELDKTPDYNEAVTHMRTLSYRINSTYRKAFQQLVKYTAELVDQDNCIGKIKLKKVNPNNTLLPLRDIVLNGDDVTFVCDARLAIDLSEYFLQLIKDVTVVDGGSDKFSACAGICIVNSHFPFYRAYDIAEECCSTAKKRAKSLAKENNTKVKSWLDYHIVQRGITTDLETTRGKFYNQIDDGPTYQLLWRPFIVDPELEENEEVYHIDYFKEIFNHFKTHWPRTRVKKLRNTLPLGIDKTKLLLSELKSRGYHLPIFMGVEKGEAFTLNNQTPFYDALEIFDIYAGDEVKNSAN